MDLIWAALVLAAVVAMTVLALSKVVDPRRTVEVARQIGPVSVRARTSPAQPPISVNKKVGAVIYGQVWRSRLQ